MQVFVIKKPILQFYFVKNLNLPYIYLPFKTVNGIMVRV